MTYKQMLKNKILEVIQNLDKPCFIPSNQIAEMVKESWSIKGIDITPDKIGKILRELGYSSRSDGKQRGWIIF